MRMPVLFVGHGSPLTLEQPGRFAEWQQWGASMPKPKAILMISAHWETRPLMIGAEQTLPAKPALLASGIPQKPHHSGQMECAGAGSLLFSPAVPEKHGLPLCQRHEHTAGGNAALPDCPPANQGPRKNPAGA